MREEIKIKENGNLYFEKELPEKLKENIMFRIMIESGEFSLIENIIGAATTAGGAAAEAITIPGVLATDIAFVNYGATNDTDVITKAVCSVNTLTVTCSADPSTAHSIHYVVIRPRGTFKPSHYIAYAGKHTTVGGAAAEAVTISGALSTDIPIVIYNTTNDTDSILKVVMTTDTMTVTCSADPSTVHAFSYMLLRAY